MYLCFYCKTRRFLFIVRILLYPVASTDMLVCGLWYIFVYVRVGGPSCVVFLSHVFVIVILATIAT